MYFSALEAAKRSLGWVIYKIYESLSKKSWMMVIGLFQIIIYLTLTVFNSVCVTFVSLRAELNLIRTVRSTTRVFLEKGLEFYS